MKTKIDDPDYGVMKYRYNAFGELMSQTSPKNITTSYEYDILGRTVSRSVLNNTNGNEELTAWFYENNANGKKGTLKAILHDNNSVSYQYDNLLRVTSESETFDGETYNTSYTYDQYGRLDRTTYPSGFVTFNAYNEGGFLCVIKDSDKKMLWQANQYNAMGHLINCRSGNMISTNKTYEANTGRLTRIRTSLVSNILQNIVYSYDDFGNFASRRNITGLVYNEHFTYDDFNRLTSSSMGDEECKMTYDKYGRILSKKSHNMSFLDARYHSDKPHALKKYTSYTEPPFSNHSVTYTDFDKVETVSMDENTLQFAYGHDHHRRHMTETVDSVTRSKTYIGNCEFVQSATDGEYSLTYLYGGDGIFAVVKKSAGVETVYYVHTDHLGSWSLITDKNSNVLQRCYFDAWGDVSITNGNGISVDKLMFDRGFTGHEHHYDFGLINMNGRMYDSYTSMFLSPDNYIQAPDNSQSFNRYAYCLNNPLKYTDPDGEFWHIIAGAALGGSMNLIMNWSKCEQWYDFASYFAIGAVAGGLSAGVGAGVSSAIAGGGFAAGFTGASTASATGFVAGAAIGGASGFTGGFITGAGNSLVAGDSFGRSLYNGTIDGAIGLGVGAVIGGVAGGVKYRKDMMVFRKGSVELGIDPANSIPENLHNDNFLIRARNVWYPDAPKDNLKIFSVENVPIDVMNSMKNNNAIAVTRPIAKGGIFTGYSNMYFNKDLCFRSAEELFFAMGHEFVHVSQFAYLGSIKYPFSEYKTLGLSKIMDHWAYNYEDYLRGETILHLQSETPFFNILDYINYKWHSNYHYIFPLP